MKPTNPLSLKGYKIKTTQDMIIFFANKEDQKLDEPLPEFTPMKFEIPQYQKPYECAGWRNFYKQLIP